MNKNILLILGAIIFFVIIVPKIFNFFNAWIAIILAIAGVFAIINYIKNKLK